MHTKIYRIASSKYGILLFPTPVDKQSMYLINAPTLFHAEVYKHLLDFAALFSPLISKNQYEKVAVHSDGVTEIFDLNWNTMQLSFLPEKHLDLKRATILESLFTKKFKHLFLYPDSRIETIKDIQFRFSQQQLCSECQKLGIDRPELRAWFAALEKWNETL